MLVFEQVKTFPFWPRVLGLCFLFPLLWSSVHQCHNYIIHLLELLSFLLDQIFVPQLVVLHVHLLDEISFWASSVSYFIRVELKSSLWLWFWDRFDVSEHCLLILIFVKALFQDAPWFLEVDDLGRFSFLKISVTLPLMNFLTIFPKFAISLSGFLSTSLPSL